MLTISIWRLQSDVFDFEMIMNRIGLWSKVLVFTLLMSSTVFAQFDPSGCNYITNEKGEFLTEVDLNLEFSADRKTAFCSELQLDGRVSLKAISSGYFVTARNDNSIQLYESPVFWSSFTFSEEVDGSLLLESVHGTHLAAGPKNKLILIKTPPSEGQKLFAESSK